MISSNRQINDEKSSMNKNIDDLHKTLQEIKEWIQECKNKNTQPSNEKKYEFVENIIKILSNAKEIDTNASKPISSVKTSFELIVVWGMVPRFLHGVGIPAEKRVSHSKWMFLNTSIFSDEEKLRSEECEILYKCVTSILNISKISTFFKSVVYNNYMSDILASLLQLIHAPKYYKKTSQDAKFGLSKEKIQECIDILHLVLHDASEVLLIESLMILLSQKNAPIWFKKFISSLLSKTLLRKKGVYAMLDVMLSQNEADVHKFERIANLIAKTPSFCKSNEDYYKIICPQIIQLLHINGKNVQHLRRGSLMIAGKLIQKDPKLAKKYLLDPITKPLQVFIEIKEKKKTLPKKEGEKKVDTSLLNLEDELPQEERMVVDESELALCVEDIHKILTGNPPSDVLFQSLTFIIPALFQLYCFINQTNLYLKSACEEIITTYFKLSNDGLSIIKKLVAFKREEKHEEYYIFAPGESGGVCIKKVKYNQRDYLWEAQCIIDLLKLMKHSSVAGDLFVYLVSQFSLLKQEENINKDSMLLLQVIKLIIEQLGPTIMKNTSQTITFIKFLLLNHENDKDEDGLETLAMALGMLSAVLMSDYKFDGNDEQKLEDLEPILSRLKNHPEQQISEMAVTCNLAISTKQYKTTEETLSKEEKTRIKIKHILKDLKDPILPVRAHGIKELRKLVLSKDETIKKNLKKVLGIFESEIKDEDTYIYYGAIQGLSAMGDVYPDKVIPILVNSYQNTEIPIEHRLKIGEALLDIARRCGQVLPKYSDYFVNTFLHCARERKEGSELIRTSSLSNVATICEILRFGIHKYMQDIIDCSTSLLKFDEDVTVRRAAVHIFSRILKGLGGDVFDVLPDHMKQITQLMKQVEFYDKDEIVKCNARIVLSEIHDATRERLNI